MRMPNERIIARETEKNKRCTRCSNDGSSASLASYSPLNARLNALLSPVSYRWNSGAASPISLVPRLSKGAGREGKREPGCHCLRMCQIFREFSETGYLFVNLRNTKHHYRWCHYKAFFWQQWRFVTSSLLSFFLSKSLAVLESLSSLSRN